MSKPQFSHLKVGIVTATSQESCDEQENKSLASCPGIVVSVAVVVNRIYQSKPGLRVFLISRVSLTDSCCFCF